MGFVLLFAAEEIPRLTKTSRLTEAIIAILFLAAVVVGVKYYPFPTEEDRKLVISSGIIAAVLTVLFGIFVFVYNWLYP